MKRTFGKSLTWAVVLSETGHLFCCVFPTVFSLLGFLAGLGVIAALPPSMIALHDFMHAWEVPVIMLSGFLLTLGWAVHYYGRRFDCHDTGCVHGACGPVKKRADLMLKIATFLFIFNVLIYVGVHRSVWFSSFQDTHEHHAVSH